MLPTYLGARVRVDDLRTLMTLDRAAEAARAFRDRSGSFAGFGVEDGEAAASELLWTDELPAPDTSSEPELWVRIAASTERRVELVLAGPVTTYCVRIGDGGGSTFGTAVQGQESERVRSAVARCGDQVWTDDLLEPFPVDGLCDGVVEPSITICRAVQEMLRERLASPTGVT